MECVADEGKWGVPLRGAKHPSELTVRPVITRTKRESMDQNAFNKWLLRATHLEPQADQQVGALVFFGFRWSDKIDLPGWNGPCRWQGVLFRSSTGEWLKQGVGG